MMAYDHKNAEKWMLLLFPAITLFFLLGLIATLWLVKTFVG